MESLVFLTYFGIVLLMGLVATFIAKKLKIPNILLLILIGIGSQYVTIKGEPVIYFPPTFIEVFAIFALIVIVFDSASNFKLKEFDTLSMSVVKLTTFFLIFNAVFLSLAVYFFYLRSVEMALLFALLMAGTAPDVVLSSLKDMKAKVLELIKIESLLNTPLIVIFPFVILDFITHVTERVTFSLLFYQIAPFLSKIVAGIGAGILIGLIIFKLMKKFYKSEYSPIGVIVSAIITYILAENLGGDGVLAVTTMGLFFGNMALHDKGLIAEFSTIFSDFLEILVFILIGYLIKIPFTWQFMSVALLLFVIGLLIRFLAVELALGKEYALRQKFFIAINNTKGIAVAVVVVVFASYMTFPGIKDVSNLALAFMLLSIIVSSIFVRFAKYFAAPAPAVEEVKPQRDESAKVNELVEKKVLAERMKEKPVVEVPPTVKVVVKKRSVRAKGKKRSKKKTAKKKKSVKKKTKKKSKKKAVKKTVKKKAAKKKKSAKKKRKK